MARITITLIALLCSAVAIQAADPPSPTVPPRGEMPQDAMTPPGVNRWGADFLVGLPTGIRVQRTLGAGGLIVEGFAGIEVFLPMIGGGVRYRFTPLCGDTDAFTIAPGIAYYVLYNPMHDNGGLLGGGQVNYPFPTADVDFAWRHAYAGGWEGELGIKLGIGAAKGKEDWFALPVASLYVGIRF